MSRSFFYRNVLARDQLDLFLLAAASSLLSVRLYLYLAGYPQIGGDGLHIAHMLWGGALMLAAIIILLSFLGTRAMRLAAAVGGAGFGVFIDELGKFITDDNDYFFQPTVGIIYAIFIVLYLAFTFMNRSQRFTSREYQLNALAQFEEAVARNMDTAEKARIGHLLAKADQSDPLTQRLRRFLADVETIPPPAPGPLHRLLRALDRAYERFWQRRTSDTLVRIFFLAEVLMFIASVWVIIYLNLGGAWELFYGPAPLSFEVIGQLVSSLIAAGFATYGAFLLRVSRMRAYEQFRRATLVNIFLTEFFMFLRASFGALPGFFFNMALLALIGFAIHQERRMEARRARGDRAAIRR